MERHEETQRGGRVERVILTFSPLPQDAFATEREVAEEARVLDVLRRWGDHLARAIRTSDRLAADGWRLMLRGDAIIAEKRTDREGLARLARQLRGDLAALTASAEQSGGQSEDFLTLEGDEIRPREGDEFRPLVDD